MSAVSVNAATVARNTIGFAKRAALGVDQKLRSVRSTFWTAAAAVIGTLGLAIVICSRYVWLLHRGQDGGGFEPTELSLSGVYLAQVAFVRWVWCSSAPSTARA